MKNGNRNLVTRIDIKKDNKLILKFGFGLIAFFSFAVTFMFMLIGFLYLKKEPFSSVMYFGLAIFFFFVTKKYIASTFYNEYVLVDNKILRVVYKSWGKFRKNEFKLQEIKYIKYVGVENFTEHPLSNDRMDYLGFGASEKEIQHVISDGTIEIRTSKTQLRFGKDIPSWEAERVISAIKKAIKL